MSELTPTKSAFTGSPEITLVRSMVPEVGTKTLNLYSVSREVEEVSSSRFGDPDEHADLSCLNAGILESIPAAEIVPTSVFWEQVVAPKEAIELSELFVAPALHLWQELNLSFLVIAYQKSVDTESLFLETVIEGGYMNRNQETAAIVVIETQNQEIVHASKFTVWSGQVVLHFLFIPAGSAVVSSTDLCDAIAKQAGKAIASSSQNSAPRVLIVAAGNDPYDATEVAYKAAITPAQKADITYLEKRAYEGDAESAREYARLTGNDEPLIKVTGVDRSHAAFGMYNWLYIGGNPEDSVSALEWLCRAANLNHGQAQSILALHHREGLRAGAEHLVTWRGQAGIRPDNRVAYLWYTLAIKNGEQNSQAVRDKELAPKMTDYEIAKAEEWIQNWRPGHCPRPPEHP